VSPEQEKDAFLKWRGLGACGSPFLLAPADLTFTDDLAAPRPLDP
jgi:hypothetical protein